MIRVMDSCRECRVELATVNDPTLIPSSLLLRVNAVAVVKGFTPRTDHRSHLHDLDHSGQLDGFLICTT